MFLGANGPVTVFVGGAWWRSMNETPPAPLPQTFVHRDRTVTLRRLAASDVDGLDALYRSLPVRDRHRRFFTDAAPPRRTVERYAALLDDPGFGVVAVAADGRIVAEAGYARPAGGDGEFGITVAGDWRGLGSVLLDRITAQAATAGVRGLRADVLPDNAAMLRLAARRGYALIHTADRTVLRMIIGTGATVPPWPQGTPAPRLLVETSGGNWRAAAEAEAAGFHVLSCPGRTAIRTGRCPVLHGEACPLVEGCDAVVVALPHEQDPAALAHHHRRRHPGLPVVIDEVGDGGRPSAEQIVAALVASLAV